MVDDHWFRTFGTDSDAARMGSVGAEYEGRDIPVRPIHPHPCGRTGRNEAFPPRFTFEKPYPEFVGCFITGANHLVSFNWIVLMIYEAVTLVLMIIPAIAAYRNGGNIPFYHVIYRDGLMVYVYLFTFSIINVVVVNTLPEEYIDLLSSVERVLHSMLTSRVILEVRQYISRQSAWKDGLTDLQIDLDASVPEKRFRRPHNRGPLAGERRTPR